MEAPDKIFCWRGVLGTLFCSLKKGTNTDCTEYIRKDALLEWAKENQEKCFSVVEDDLWHEVIDKINEI